MFILSEWCNMPFNNGGQVLLNDFEFSHHPILIEIKVVSLTYNNSYY